MLAIIVKIVHLLVCVGLIVIVLFQADKGEGLAGAFGGGASSTVFGERGSGGFMSKLTTALAVVFMITSLVIAVNGAKWDREAALEARRAPITATPAPIQSAPVIPSAPAVTTTPSAPVAPVAPAVEAPKAETAPAQAVQTPAVEAPKAETAPAQAVQTLAVEAPKAEATNN